MSSPPLPRMFPLFDAHCHLQDKRLSDWQRVVFNGDDDKDQSGDEEEERKQHQLDDKGEETRRRRHRRLDTVVAAARASGVRGVACCSCAERDWSDVASLADRYPGFVFPSFGLHPWFLSERKVGWERRLEALLRERPGAGVGESGVDRAKPTNRGGRWGLPSVEEQVEVMREHARIARELRRPLTVHCVRAAGALIEALSPFAPFSRCTSASPSSSPSLPRSLGNTSLVVHGWNGSAEEARRLMRLGDGVFFSLGTRSVLQPRKRRKIDEKASRDGDDSGGGFLSHVPLDRLLIETDSPDGYSPLAGPGIAVLAPQRDSGHGAETATGKDDDSSLSTASTKRGPQAPSSPGFGEATPAPVTAFLNQPATLLELLPRVASALGEAEEDVRRASYENARDVFCVVGGEANG